MPTLEWTEFCPRCDAFSAGTTADDGCYWACNSCEGHYDESTLHIRPDIPFEGSEEGDSMPEPAPDAPAWMRDDLPAGWEWRVRPPTSVRAGSIITSNGGSADYVDTLSELQRWATERDAQVVPQRVEHFYSDGAYVARPRRLFIAALNTPIPDGLGWPDEIECPDCGDYHSPYRTRCPESGVLIACAGCTTVGMPLAAADTGGFYCENCRHECDEDGCTTFVYEGDARYCDAHGVHTSCGICGQFVEHRVEDELEPVEQYGVLCDLHAAFVCRRCNHYRSELEDGGEMCRACHMSDLCDGQDGETPDVSDLMENSELLIQAIPGRENIRRCGVEIEGANGSGTGHDLAIAFCDLELNESDEVYGYHHGRTSGFAHVERDSSVDWEAVIGPINPARQSDMTRFNQAIRQIRTMVHDEVLGLDLRSGCHIHVEAAQVSLDSAFNLSVLFGYLEDTIFRLGAARWPIHRALANDHYTMPIPKENRKVAFARANNENDDSRYFALSFSNYFERMLGGCRCGATRYDSWDECTCDLGKCTFEFRVFNTTANPRKLHAYLALCQALVAKALTLGKIDPEFFPTMAFEPRRFKDMTEMQQETLIENWRDRLEWLFNELPLTDDEKQSLAYCVRHSELAQVGEDFITTLLPIDEQQVTTEEVIA